MKNLMIPFALALTAYTVSMYLGCSDSDPVAQVCPTPEPTVDPTASPTPQPSIFTVCPCYEPLVGAYRECFETTMNAVDYGNCIGPKKATCLLCVTDNVETCSDPNVRTYCPNF